MVNSFIPTVLSYDPPWLFCIADMTLLASAALGVFPRQSSKVLSASDHHLQASEGTPPEARAAVRGDAWIQTMHAVAHDVKLKT